MLIRRMRLLSELTPDEVAAVQAIHVDTVFTRLGRAIFKEGAASNRLYVVLDGWAAKAALRVNGSRRITSILLRGDFCGVHAISGSKFEHDLIALTDCKIGWISGEVMADLAARYPGINTALWRASLVEAATLRKWLLTSDDAYHAVAHLLCELVTRGREIGLATNNDMSLPITQEQIGDALSLTSVHVNRIVRRMRQEGLIAITNKTLWIMDEEELQRAGQFDPSYLCPWE